MDTSSAQQRSERPRSRTWDGSAVRQAFADASSSHPWTLGYESLNEDMIRGEAELSGKLPPGLRGVLYRNGPARHELGGQRYGHRWDGDGMIQRFEFSDRGVAHVGRYVQTKKYAAESAEGRFLVSAFGTHIPGSDAVPEDIDDVNPANISVRVHGGELLALWEAGSAYVLDPHTLGTLGPKTWGAPLAGRPFSAHPRVEGDGTMWNFGTDPLTDELTIYRISADGHLVDGRVLQVSSLPPVHDFGVTENHLVFLLPPLIINKERLFSGAAFAEACQWTPQLGMRVLTLDKRDWSQRWYELAPGCLFHVANAWEDLQGVIRLHYMRSRDPISLLAGWSVMRGAYRHHEGARLTYLKLDPIAGTATQETVGTQESEFPIVETADVGRHAQHVLCLERSDAVGEAVPGFDQVSLLDVEHGNGQRFKYGDGMLAEEHLLVASEPAGRSRWIVGSALDLRSRRTVVSVFDINGLADGPIAQARLPYPLPLGLHGTYQL